MIEPTEHNPTITAARFMRVLLAEQGAVTRSSIDARTAPLAAREPIAAPPQLVAVRASSSWRSDANCAGVDPDLFFPERGGSKAAQAVQIDQAKAVCAGCTVRAQCLVDALERGEVYGIWGGLSDLERRGLRRRLPRVARCVRCSGRFVKTKPGTKFCGDSCPGLGRGGRGSSSSRRVAS